MRSSTIAARDRLLLPCARVRLVGGPQLRSGVNKRRSKRLLFAAAAVAGRIATNRKNCRLRLYRSARNRRRWRRSATRRHAAAAAAAAAVAHGGSIGGERGEQLVWRSHKRDGSVCGRCRVDCGGVGEQPLPHDRASGGGVIGDRLWRRKRRQKGGSERIVGDYLRSERLEMRGRQLRRRRDERRRGFCLLLERRPSRLLSAAAV